jgi:hypothetical protein
MATQCSPIDLIDLFLEFFSLAFIILYNFFYTISSSLNFYLKFCGPCWPTTNEGVGPLEV